MNPDFMHFMQAMYKTFQQGAKHDPTGDPVGGLYQEGGIFTYPFAGGPVFSAVQQPRTFLSVLPFRESRIENEVTEILTGVTDASGENAENVCGDPPTPGNLKVCRTNLIFGKAFIGSKVVDVTEVGGQQHWAANERQIQNFAMSSDPLVPDPLRITNVSFASDAALRLYEVATMLRRILARIEVDGDSSVASASAELGWIREFSGLSRLIKEDYVDVGGGACTAVDSLVVDWSAAVDAEVNGLTLAQAMNDIYFAKKQLAFEVGMEGTQFAVVMDMRLFRAVAFLFACDFVHTRCGDASDAEPISRTADQISARFRDYTRNQYLPLEGDNVPVLFTSGADVDTEADPFTASWFLVPMSWNGRPLIEIEYFNLSNSVAQEFNRIGNTTARMYSNNGLYAFATRSNGFCDQLLAVTKMRLKLWTPFLAARIDNIEFNSYLGYRGWDPAGTSFYNGGTTFYNQTMPTPL